MPTAEERRTAAARVRGSVLELEVLLAPLVEIEREAERTGGKDSPGIGHNRPPSPIEDAALPPDFFLSLRVEAGRISEAVGRTEEILEQSAATADNASDSTEPEDQNILLARVMAEHGDALRESSTVVKENSELLRENSRKLDSLKKAGLIGAAAAAIGTVFNGALTKIGEMLVEKGVALLKPLGPSAQAYLELVVTKLGQVVKAASQYISSLPFPF